METVALDTRFRDSFLLSILQLQFFFRFSGTPNLFCIRKQRATGVRERERHRKGGTFTQKPLHSGTAEICGRSTYFPFCRTCASARLGTEWVAWLLHFLYKS